MPRTHKGMREDIRRQRIKSQWQLNVSVCTALYRIVFGGINQEHAECVHLRRESWELQHKTHDWKRWVTSQGCPGFRGWLGAVPPMGTMIQSLSFVSSELRGHHEGMGNYNAAEQEPWKLLKILNWLSLKCMFIWVSFSLPWIDRIMFPTISWNDLKS